MASRNGSAYGAKGTSYAAAHVSAAAALLLAADGEQTPQQLCQRLYDRAVDIGEPGRDSSSGWGILGPVE